MTPYANDDGVGVPMARAPYRFAFGGDGTPEGIDLDEPRRLLTTLADLGVRMICTTAGSPYYNPHVQRPAYFPPSDGYAPPEDPLVGVARQLAATAALKHSHPDLTFVGSGYSYLQDWLAHVAQPQVARGAVDVVGIGRMVLSYPDLPADVLAGAPLDRRRICRTFSDCTTAPRNGLVSGCYPLDPGYKTHPDREQLVVAKRRARTSGVSAKTADR
jgi:2,4-dienoyl-CoA reductase-like NADH-dependent reductase (Old Yellow Enzyme family)